MFHVRIFRHHDELLIGEGSGKTVSTAITAAGRAAKQSDLPADQNGFPQVNDTCGVRVYEDSDSAHAVGGKVVVFTAYDFGVHAALRQARAMNRKSRSGGGR